MVEWASIIHDHLMKMVKKHYKDPIRNPGCVVQLLVSLSRNFYSFRNLLFSVFLCWAIGAKHFCIGAKSV